jgi:hypothetical protein
MKTLNKYIGLDVHKDTTVIAVAEDGRAGAIRWGQSVRSYISTWKAGEMGRNRMIYRNF